MKNLILSHKKVNVVSKLQKWIQHKCFCILQFSNISPKYKTFLYKWCFVVFLNCKIFGKHIDTCGSIQLSDLWLENSDSRMIFIPTIKSFSRPKDWSGKNLECPVLFACFFHSLIFKKKNNSEKNIWKRHKLIKLVNQ